MKRILFSLILGIMLIGLVNAVEFQDCTVYGNCRPITTTASVNYSIINVNNSAYWNGIGSINATQMESNGGVLNILTSWLNTFLNTFTFTTLSVGNGASSMGKTFNANGTARIGSSGEISYCIIDDTLAGTQTLYCFKGGNGRDVLQLKKASAGGAGDLIEAFEGNPSVFKVVAGGGVWINDSQSTMPLQIVGNKTGLTCNAGNAGSIYYDGSQNKHLGCNSTTWNALY